MKYSYILSTKPRSRGLNRLRTHMEDLGYESYFFHRGEITREDFEGSITDLANKTADGDKTFIYLDGHGVPFAGSHVYSLGGREHYIHKADLFYELDQLNGERMLTLAFCHGGDFLGYLKQNLEDVHARGYRYPSDHKPGYYAVAFSEEGESYLSPILFFDPTIIWTDLRSGVTLDDETPCFWMPERIRNKSIAFLLQLISPALNLGIRILSPDSELPEFGEMSVQRYYDTEIIL